MAVDLPPGWQEDLEFIRAMIRFEIDLDLFGVSTAWQHLVKRDPQVQLAVQSFPEARQLLEVSRKTTTRRAQR